MLFGGQGRVGLAGQGLGGGPRASVPGGVGGRGTGPRDGACVVFLCVFVVSNAYKKKEEKWRFLKDALWGGGGVPTGAGLVDGGVDQGPWLQERVGGGVGAGWQFQRRGRVGAWLAVPNRASPGKGWLAWQFHRRGQGLGGESKGFGSGRVGVLFFESWRVDLVVTCSRRGLPCAVWCRSHCRSDCEGRTKHGLLSGDLSREATYGQQCSQFHVMP